jgi:hypothetical protein
MDFELGQVYYSALNFVGVVEKIYSGRICTACVIISVETMRPPLLSSNSRIILAVLWLLGLDFL